MSLLVNRNIFIVVFIAGATAASFADSRPNILFCLADDWGWPHAGVYGDEAVQTPAFDRLAREGVLFQHAYVASPSCTPCRNTVITGKYFWELGPGANLWSTLPGEHQSFIHLLRDNGYVTGRSKQKTWGPGQLASWIEKNGDHPATTGYDNFEQFLKQQHYLKQTDGQDKPFFYWMGTSDPHRPYDTGAGVASGIDLKKVHLFEHFPDNDIVRSDVADYYFEVQRWDRKVGAAIKLLEQHNLLENTIIIMTGDHGMPFPRCKGNLYDCGVRVPFAVRWSKAIKAGRNVTDFISFTDIAPTLLELGQTPIPADMTGSSFANLLASEQSGRLQPEQRSSVIFGRERHVPAQEKPNTAGYPSRGLRTDAFLYIRNYHPERWPAGTMNSEKANFPNQFLGDCDNGPTKTYIYENRDLDEAHRRAYELCFAKRPAEELYDLKQDPAQLHNVAADPEYAETLAKLRAELVKRLTTLHDPRATDPDYTGFDAYPYYGKGGGSLPNNKNHTQTTKQAHE